MTGRAPHRATDAPPSLADLLAALPPARRARIIGDPDTTVTGMTHDSRQVAAGSLFACVRGAHHDGHDHAAAAVAAGAAALLVDRELADVGVGQLAVDEVRLAMGPVASAVQGDPSRALTVVGITGTNGKTTTTHLLAAITRAAGAATTVIGTLSGTKTTPEAPELQARLAAAVASGDTAVVMEVSSHALALHRVDGTRFAAATFTNLGNDHLDLHGTVEEYFRAKARLFTPELSAVGVSNADDPHGRLLLDAEPIEMVPYSLADAGDLVVTADHHELTWRGARLWVPLGGAFNVANTLAAATTAAAIGIDTASIVAGLAAAATVPGRFERVRGGRDDILAIVDYAHTPDGLAEVIAAARAVATGAVIIVFGAGGDRDHPKRPRMGAVAAAGADRVVVTSDNPRSEDPAAIIGAVMDGVHPEHRARVVVEADRAAAIAVAIDSARPGDVVIVAGKGHETTQTIGDQVLPFDDREVVRELLERQRVIAVMIAGVVAGVLSLVVTRFLITVFRTRGLGQPILGKEDRGPEHHMAKQGTPTMGGIAILVAALVGWVVAHIRRGLPFSDQALIVWVGILVMAFMGFLDDFIKVRKRHNRGIFWKQKNYITMLLSIGIAWWLVAATGISTTISLTRADYPGWEVPTFVWVLFAGLIIWATTNAVNVTDGLDGLAGGSALMGFGAFVIIGYWAFRNPDIYGAVVNPLDLAAMAAAFGGACMGFLWFNAAPARIIMGDVGALGLGSSLALLGLTTNTSLLLVLICGLNVMEAGSVALQMAVFKASGRKKRIFRMSPIHHHFELLGWPETTVIIRFWLIAATCVAAALGLFIGDFTPDLDGAAVILVHGLAVAGAATARALQARGATVVASDDAVDDRKRALADELGVELVVAPSEDRMAQLVAASEMVVPAPGVPETHQLFRLAAAADVPVVSELELAYQWEQERPGGPRPMLTVTGTDGKTTTTLLTVAILEAAGVRAVDAGNTDTPLVTAIDLDVDAFVVECTSFRLAWTQRFRGDAAVWLNLAPDHLNWHTGMASYEAAKARLFSQQRPTDSAIGFADDPVVMRHLAAAPARRRTFALRDADYHVVGSGPDAVLTGPTGPLAPVSALRRALPHDLTNGLAAAALAIEAGLAGADAVAAALATFVGPPHRIELVGDADGVRWFNDSKATTPHAASVAIKAFDHIVLIAGGLNKGLDLRPMAAAPERIRAVVAIGEAADVIAETFAGAAPTVAAGSMAEAVARAADLARPGDVVLLSPGCASFDWYPEGGYPARGEDFRQLVTQRIGGGS